MREFLNDGKIRLVLGPMCHWRMDATDDRIEQGFVRGKTRWATSSSKLATLLAREHAGENRRVRLSGQNRMFAGASDCTLLDQQQTFLSWTHKDGKKTIKISKEICSTQSRSSKEKERKSIGC